MAKKCTNTVVWQGKSERCNLPLQNGRCRMCDGVDNKKGDRDGLADIKGVKDKRTFFSKKK